MMTEEELLYQQTILNRNQGGESEDENIIKMISDLNKELKMMTKHISDIRRRRIAYELNNDNKFTETQKNLINECNVFLQQFLDIHSTGQYENDMLR